MSKSLYVHSTDDYDKFQTYSCNRITSPDHVNKLYSDPSFPEKFPSSPIVVNSKFYVIDGQHRLKAAQKLGIPVYYLIDKNADEKDIKMRNQQMKNWSITDIIHYYASDNDNYKFLEQLKEKYEINYSFILSVVNFFGKARRYEASYNLKNGKLNILKRKNEIEEFLGSYVPNIKKCKEMKSTGAAPLFLFAYIIAAIKLFQKDKKSYLSFLKNIHKCSLEFPYTAKNGQADGYIMRIAKWRPASIAEKD